MAESEADRVMPDFPVQQARSDSWDEANPSEYTLLKELDAWVKRLEAKLDAMLELERWLSGWQDDLSKKMDRLEAMVVKLQEDVLIIKRLLVGHRGYVETGTEG